MKEWKKKKVKIEKRASKHERNRETKEKANKNRIIKLKNINT